MELPLWLNTEFLTAAIGDGQRNINVLQYDVKPAVPEGNNYFSCLYRIQLNYKIGCSQEIQSTSLIVKAPITNGVFQDFADKINIAHREAEIYNLVLPQINRYLGEDSITPKTYFSLKNDVLVLEDLSHQGYSMCDRIKQLDHDHCLSCMRALAKFHACSVAFHEANPILIETVGKEFMFAEDTGWYEDQKKYMKKYFTYTANGLKTIKSYEMLGEMVLQRMDSTWDKLVTLFSKAKYIKVLNHGDVWTNNVLFKYDEHGRVTDVKFVDFQMYRFASPGIDILYFLVTSPNADVRRNGFSDLIYEYRSIFNATLRKLNCTIQLSAAQLEEEIRNAESFALFVICDLLPIVLADPEKPPGVVDDKNVSESLDPNADTFLQIYYNRRFLDLAAEHLKRLDETGFVS